jgi:glycosyltransferase involved in cell wall biosynthesis
MTAAASHPHKNLDILVDAFSLIIKIREYRDLKLFITGFPSLAHRAILDKIEELNLDRNVVFLGWLERKKYYEFLRKARAFVFISLYEGFGFPPLEAMSVGTPVVVSNRGSLGEILKDTAVTVENPRSSIEVSKKIMQVIGRGGEKKYSDLIKYGLETSGNFGWDKSYKKIEKVANELFLNVVKTT